MAAAMLASYPEAPGAVRSSRVCPTQRLQTYPKPSTECGATTCRKTTHFADRERNAPDYEGPWPSISIWHGAADSTVDPLNMEAFIAPWHGVQDQLSHSERSRVAIELPFKIFNWRHRRQGIHTKACAKINCWRGRSFDGIDVP
jgi:poly(3-hydroxybutyrate) depolymerase